MLLNNEWVNNKIKEIKKFLETKENEHTTVQTYGTQQRQTCREVHSDTNLPKKKIEIFQINNLTLHLQKLGEQQQTKPRASRRKEITKI